MHLFLPLSGALSVLFLLPSGLSTLAADPAACVRCCQTNMAWHSASVDCLADARWPSERGTFCSVRAIKRGSGALVNTEERNSTHRQEHGSARDNVISALLGPLLSATRWSAEIIVWGERGDAEETFHPSHGSPLLLTDLPKEVTHCQFFNARHWRGCVPAHSHR